MAEVSEKLFWVLKMFDENEKLAVAAVIHDVLSTVPNELLQSYKAPPGRKPSPELLEISRSISKLDDEEIRNIIRDVTDYTIFSIFYLIDAKFKNFELSTKFTKQEIGQTDLVAYYRSLVDPGGKVLPSDL